MTNMKMDPYVQGGIYGDLPDLTHVLKYFNPIDVKQIEHILPKMCAILTYSECLYIINSDNVQAVLENNKFQPTQKEFGMDLQVPVFLTPGEIVKIPAKVK